MHIYLIGFMGSGKTTIGQVLAKNLGLRFVDLDDLIEEAAGTSISCIFKEKGEKGFRLMERQALHTTRQFSNTIIATGGGTPCHFDNMEWIKNNGMSIYLKASPALLRQRLLSQQEHRPLLRKLSEKELLNYIENMLEEREAFYKQADIEFEQSQNSAEELAQELATHFEEIIGH